MDEPFAALDEQTRMTMGHESCASGRRQPTVVTSPTASPGAVCLADEVLVMSARPGASSTASTSRCRGAYEMMATDVFGRRDRIWQQIRKAA